MVVAGARYRPGPFETRHGTGDSGLRLSNLFPEILVSPHAADWAQEILAGFFGHEHAIGFECPLAGTDPDFAILMKGMDSDLPFPMPYPFDFAWFSYEAGHSAADGPAGIHMGFDIKRPIHDIDHGLRESIQSGFESIAGTFASAEGDWEFHPDMQKALRNIPEGTEIWNISRMPSRAGKPWKVNLSVPREGLSPFLEKCGWTGDMRVLKDLLGLFALEGEMIRIDIGFAAAMLPRIGMELFAGVDRFPESARTRALDRLVSMDLCSLERRQAINSWRGLKLASSQEPSVPWLAIGNWYLKLCVNQEGSVSAKAYLYCRPVPLPVA
jgi:hypothetical protein